MILGILNESDNRVAIVPDVIEQLNNFGFTIQMVKDAGLQASFPDALYKEKKVKIVSKATVLSSSDIIVTFNPINTADQAKCKERAILISRYAPYDYPKKISTWAQKKNTIFSLDMIPRITVAQSADVLSSLASIAGYKAVLLAAEYMTKYIPMLTTAAGSIPPAKVLVIGAGVAGLQAIATAKRLGAVVEAFDTRTAARDEVRSLGAKFVEVEGATDDVSAGGYAVEQTEEYKQKQKEILEMSVEKADVIITTAQLRGKPAPILITKEMVNTMKPGSVIIDLASKTGGNCELTKDRQEVNNKGITIFGDSDLSERVATHASLLYSRNVINFLKFMVDDNGKISKLHLNHEILEKSCVIREGKQLLGQDDKAKEKKAPAKKQIKKSGEKKATKKPTAKAQTQQKTQSKK